MGRFDEALAVLRAVCDDLPEVTERPSHGAPTFFVRAKTSFCMLHDDHHGAHGVAIWCAAPAGAQAELVEEDPERFFRPPYVGHRGWLGVHLDVEPDWDEVRAVVTEAYRCVAPARLLRLLDAGAT